MDHSYRCFLSGNSLISFSVVSSPVHLRPTVFSPSNALGGENFNGYLKRFLIWLKLQSIKWFYCHLSNHKVFFDLKFSHHTITLQMEIGPWHLWVLVDVEIHRCCELTGSSGLLNQYLLNEKWPGSIVGKWVYCHCVKSSSHRVRHHVSDGFNFWKFGLSMFQYA